MQEWEKPKRTYKRKRFGPIIAIILLVAAILVQDGRLPKWIQNKISNIGYRGGQTTEVSDGQNDNLFTVHCLDVGQASAMLIVSGDHAMMIDAGNRDDAKLITGYLTEQGITSLDYLLLTHPHEDHIGSGATLLREIEVERVIMPDIPLDMCQTATYADLLAAIEEKDPLLDYPKAGDVYSLGELTFTIVAPSPEQQTDVENLNESSLGVLLTAGDNRILVYGDGEWNCEQYMIANHDIEADVLIVGHHGSNSSSSGVFLDEVSPTYAVISCGADNDYGYPHKEVLERLGQENVEIYRTDLSGHILFSGNGKNILFFNENFIKP